MSLIPYILNDFMRSSRLLDQHFGVGLKNDDFWSPYAIPPVSRLYGRSREYYRPWKTAAAEKDSGSLVNFNKNEFEIKLDVQHFAPEEISVKVTDDGSVIVEGRHGEKEDEHGYVSRHFVRRYILPNDINLNALISSLSSDGVLTITAPKMNMDGIVERIIPIQQTGMPLKNVDNRRNKQEGEGDRK